MQYFLHSIFRSNVRLMKTNHFCTISTAKNLNRHQMKALKTFLGINLEISSSEVRQLLQQNTNLHKADIQNVSKVIETLYALRIGREQIIEYPQALTAIPVTLENRGLLLEECGFENVSLKLILRYINIMKKRISLLKSYNEIAPATDIRASLYSYLEPMPTNDSVSTELPKNQTVNDVYMSVLEQYLSWRLNISNPEDFQYILKTHYRIKHKSFRLIRETLDILENVLKFPKERIRNNAFLIHSYPQNIKNILQNVDSIGDIPIKTVLFKHPKIIMTNATTIENTLNILKKHNVSNEAIRKCLRIFTLSSNLVEERIKENKRIPEFNVLSDNIRSLNLIQHQCKAKSRLDYLQKIKMKNASLHVLSTTNALFEKYISEGSDRTRGDDLLYYLQEKFKIPHEKLRLLLAKHPYWFHVPLVQIADTLSYLFSKKFKTDEILPAIQILLYPKELITTELSTLRKKTELSKTWLNPTQILNLSLYYIEFPHHFSGDGIWCHENDNASETMIL